MTARRVILLLLLFIIIIILFFFFFNGTKIFRGGGKGNSGAYRFLRTSRPDTSIRHQYALRPFLRQ